jgi:heme/copper-type cytochrome/quinol oxidase subunit 1
MNTAIELRQLMKRMVIFLLVFVLGGITGIVANTQRPERQTVLE